MRKAVERFRKQPIHVSLPDYTKRLSVIVPYRHREAHLTIFPKVLRGYLQRQEIAYQLLIIEQIDQKPFNRGMLINIGASLAMDACDYLCFHDIDMLPEYSDYGFVDHPILLANHASQFEEHSQHPSYFSGVVMFDKRDFQAVNGYSNQYWHWGYEDDDLLMRSLVTGLAPIALRAGRYESLPHPKSITQTADGEYHSDPKMVERLHRLYMRNKKRYKKMRRGLLDHQKDGLNSLKFDIVATEENALYRKISVKL